MNTINDFKQEYAKYRTTLLDTYYSTVRHSNLKKVDSNLKSLVDSSMDFVGETNKDFSEVHEFILLTLYTAFDGRLGIDSSRLQTACFGYKDCAVILDSLLQVINRNVSGVEETALANILSICRKEDYTTYINNNHYCDDLTNIAHLLNESNKHIGADSSDLNALIGEIFNKNITSVLITIRNRYDYILEGTFGIDKYKGIYTGKIPAVMQGVSNGTVKTIQPDADFVTQFHPILSNILDVTVCEDSSRQFDTKLIANTFGNSTDYKAVMPIYFPYKILEFISKSGVVKGDSFTFTKNTKLLNYNKLPSSLTGTKESYLNKIQSYFEDLIIDYIYECLVNYCRRAYKDIYPVFSEHLESGYTKEDAKDLKRRTEEQIINILEEKGQGINTSFSDLMNYIINSLKYYADCVTTAIILDKCEVAKEKSYGGSVITTILEFRIKICSRLTDSDYTNQKFIDSFIQVNQLNRSDMKTAPDTEVRVDDQGFTMLDVKYTFNLEKVSARPAFAYKALDSLLNQQSQEDRDNNIAPVSWQNILLGRNESDKIITSGVNGSINMQQNQVHWLFSGSRSGKGVMGYNIFATAIGAGIPIFYLDRKPDTATVMNALCPDMFCINGGQYDASIDTSGIFNPASYNFNIPDYLQSYFTNIDDKFDFVYYRALLLVLAMLDYADTFKDSPLGRDLQTAFGAGVVIVVDEFSNFFRNFLSDSTGKMTVSKWLNKAYSQTGMVKDIQTVSDGVEKARLALIKTQAKKGVSQAEIDMAERAVTVAESIEFGLDNLYWTAFTDAFESIFKSLSTKKDAAGAVAKSMQFFILGQTFEDIARVIDNPSEFNLGQGGNPRKYKGSEGIVPLISTFSKLSGDIITGYQKDRGSYLAQNNSSYKTKDLLNESRRCFAYRSFGSINKSVLDRIMKTEDMCKSADSVKSYLNSWTYFKPFLILNNAEEPPLCVRDANFTDNAKERLNVRKGITKLGSMSDAEQLACANSQYVGQCLDSCNNAGLSWNDLLADNDDGSGHLDSRVGFEGYITQLAGKIPVDSMSLSGQLANRFIREVYGYQGTWRDFVCDFRPEWIVSTVGYTADGSKNVVQDRLANSFFYKGVLTYHPEEVLGSKLGSLLAYYESNNTNSYEPVNEEIFERDVVEEDTQPSQVISNEPSIKTSSPLNDMQEFYRNAERQIDNTKINRGSLPVFTDEDREKYAYPIVTIILEQMSQSMGKNLRPLAPQLIENAKALLKNLGY